MPEMPQPTCQPAQQLHGFVVRDVTPLPADLAVAYLLEHQASGATVLHLHAEDKENCFSINFPTPPPDDTGLPHIMEHAVLAGSEKYPVKEPFFEMIKLSMATFINAMTGWDCTYYPVCSNVPADLWNLADVYFDAVFHPLLDRTTFSREAYHYAPADPADPTGELVISGIVYSEMKGVFSDPEQRLSRVLSRALFPDSPYGLESGGDPVAIPDLTYEQFREFHRTYYHPANAHFFFYGDIPTAEYLAFLDERLAGYSRNGGPIEIATQPRWSRPKDIVEGYPIEPEEDAAEKTYLVLQWLTGDSTDPLDALLMYVLSLVLLGNEGAPLRRALVESHLGADLLHSGDMHVGRENTFRVGLKGSEEDRLEPFCKLVTDTLTAVRDGQTEPARIEAAFQQAAYQYLEIRELHPLHIAQRALSSWIYGRDPLAYMNLAATFDRARQAWAEEPGLFNRLIDERLLQNPHHIRGVLRPQRDLQAETDADEAQRAEAVRRQLDEKQLKDLAAEAEHLAELNAQPNPPEAVAALPQLGIDDLPEKLTHIPTTVETLTGGVEMLCNDVFANGVTYLELYFDLHGLPEELWTYLPRYADAMGKLGTASLRYDEVAARVAAATGGIHCHEHFTGHAQADHAALRGLSIEIKALDERIEPAMDILGELLFGLAPSDTDRLGDVLAQARAGYQTELVHNGSQTAAYHAARGLTPEAYLREVVSGLPQLRRTDAMLRVFDEESDEIIQRIEAVRNFLLNRARVTISFTGSAGSLTTVRGRLEDWLGRMDDQPIVDAPVGFEPYATAPREGLAGPLQVNYCTAVCPAPPFESPDEHLLAVGSRMVSLEYFMSELRFQGNAYGAWFRYSPLSRTLQMGSYRDPHVARTLGVFQRTADWVAQAEWSADDVRRAIISTAKNAERPIRPAEATADALSRHLQGLTPERREARFAAMKGATAGQIKRALLSALEDGRDKTAICVVGSRAKLESANAELPAPLAIQDILG